MCKRLTTLASLAMVCALVLGAAELVMANALQAQIHVGRIWTSTENDGSEAPDIIWPAGIAEKDKYSDGTGQEIKRAWVCHVHKQGNYLFSSDWADPLGTIWPDAGSYKFRTDNGNFPEIYTDSDEKGHWNYVFPINQQEFLRWARPKVFIATADTLIDFLFFPGSEGMAEFAYPSSGGKGPRNDPIIDPTLVTEMTTENIWRYIMGVELNRVTYPYAYGTQSQDYYLEDITLTNNGILGRMTTEMPPTTADPPVLSTQVITNMIWARATDFRSNTRSQLIGTQHGQDQECMYIEPWGVGNHSVVASWDLDDEAEGGNPGPDWGDPAEDEYYMNLLLAAPYTCYGPLFVSAGGGTAYDTDDLTQPSLRTIWHEKAYDFAGKDYSPADTKTQREFLSDGALQFDIGESYRTNAATSQLTLENPGPTAVAGYGPLDGEINLANVRNHGWTLNPGESVRILNITAAGGIDQEEGRRIGQLWNTAIATSGTGAMDAADIALIQTGNDSMLKAAAIGYWNVNGEWPANVTATELAAWGISDMPTDKPTEYGPFDMVDTPRPPNFVSARANPGGGIEVRWGTLSEISKNHDTGVADVVGYRVYRQALSRVAPWELVGEAEKRWFLTRAAIPDSIPSGRFFIDGTAIPGQDYWYCVVSYDDGSQNWEQPGKSLESTRWWTWTGYSNLGVTAREGVPTGADATRANAFSLGQNTPNPFNPSTTINFSVPVSGETNLVVYNAAGQVVRTLVDGTMEAGAHRVVWNGKDSHGRDAATGVYLCRLSSDGKQLVRRMTLVR